MNRIEFRKIVVAVKAMEAADVSLFGLIRGASPKTEWTKAYRVYGMNRPADPSYTRLNIGQRLELFRNGKGILLDMPNGLIRPRACYTQEAAR